MKSQWQQQQEQMQRQREQQMAYAWQQKQKKKRAQQAQRIHLQGEDIVARPRAISGKRVRGDGGEQRDENGQPS